MTYQREKTPLTPEQIFVKTLFTKASDVVIRYPARRAVHAERAPTQRHRRTDDPAPEYAISQQKRKLVEQGFGWMKTVGGLRKLHHRGRRW